MSTSANVSTIKSNAIVAEALLNDATFPAAPLPDALKN
jgi:hypothetical protein